MSSKEKVNFELVRKNIKKDNLDIRFIRIVYRGLTQEELIKLAEKQNYKAIGQGKILAMYPNDFEPLFPNKATEIIYLGA